MMTSAHSHALQIGDKASAPRIALIQSSWHHDIVEQCCESFLASMAERGVPRSATSRHQVPGAFEIPLLAKLLARAGEHDIIVAVGFVVDGGIYRHEFVASTVINALMSVQLDTLVPIISAVLTPQQFHEHDAHSAFFRDHMVLKGAEAASACLSTLTNVSSMARHDGPAGGRAG